MADHKLEKCLPILKKDDLITLCRNLNVTGYSGKNKSELAVLAARELLNPLAMKNRFCILTESAAG